MYISTRYHKYYHKFYLPVKASFLLFKKSRIPRSRLFGNGVRYPFSQLPPLFFAALDTISFFAAYFYVLT